jgi:hypothetical protein
LLCYLAQIVERKEQAYWESKVNPFMGMLMYNVNVYVMCMLCVC